MCGVVGYIGNGNASPILLDCLHRLTYRGYDSAGIATIHNGRLQYKKSTGKLDDVERQCHLSALPGNIGIGHVRWATHGKVTSTNAHPHLDCSMEIAVVHNGIIENYEELRRELKYHSFLSETDTEVIPHLIEEEGFIRAILRLVGSYAIATIRTSIPNIIMVAKKDSPLVIGIGDGFNVVSSDTLSFPEGVHGVVYLDDGEVAVISENNFSVFNLNGDRIKKEIKNLMWKWHDSDKKEYEHFMLKEILEQPETIVQALNQDRDNILNIADMMLYVDPIIFSASGTSRYATVIGRHAIRTLTGRNSINVVTSEFHSSELVASLDNHALIVAVSQSGETADVLLGTKEAKRHGAKIVSVVNVVDSSLVRMSDRVIYLNCGPEIGVAASKSFTSQLAIFYLLSYAMANRLDEGIEEIKYVAEAISDNMSKFKLMMADLAERIKNNHSFYYIARGINYATAGEAALKMKEISYIHAEALPAGELKHGTLALVEEGTPVCGICPHDSTYNETLLNLAEAKARGAFIVGISDKYSSLFDEWIVVPTVKEIFYPMVCAIPVQLLAYYVAVEKGLNPDKPRNLAKSVTVK